MTAKFGQDSRFCLVIESYNFDELPYHIVVPSLPSYAFSSRPPLDKDFGIEDVARLLNQLMLGLGFESGYMVQGGDVGSKVARVIAAEHDECRGKNISVPCRGPPH
jgi:microsomal epoxide hydrolase